MTKDEIIKAIDKIIEGIDGDNFTIENLQALRGKILS